MTMQEFLWIGGRRPKGLRGTITLPPSKSYIHRALFVASLCRGLSRISNCGLDYSEDVLATIRTLRAFGTKIESAKGGSEILVYGRGGVSSAPKAVDAGGSGTTARFAISLAALAADRGMTRIVGNDSLSGRPMQPLLVALAELGVYCYSEKEDGTLPIVVEGRGIPGGLCAIDGSVSSQFISSLLISCVKAYTPCTIKIKNPSKLVSVPYLRATSSVLKHFGFERSFEHKSSSYKVPGNQSARGKDFAVPGDMSSAASLIAVAVASLGKVRLLGVDSSFPQSDFDFLGTARKFGAKVVQTKNSVSVDASGLPENAKKRKITLDLKDSPDLGPVTAGLGAARGVRELTIKNIAHLRFKESDRISAISKEFRKLKVPTRETSSSLSIFAKDDAKKGKPSRKPILLESYDDHRIVMALAVAALSGRFGEVMISNPACVKKSYPNFISDVQKLVREPGLVRIVKRRVRD